MRHKIMLAASLSLSIWLCMPAASMAECPGINPNNQPRLLIPLFRYSGVEAGEAKNQFSRFQGIILVKLTALIDELQHLTYLNKLGIHLPGGSPVSDTLTTPEKRRVYWTDTNALELLRGTLWPGTPYFVNSEIYIGDLRGSFPRNEVRVKLSVEPEMVSSTNDTHSLVTYYVLAMDARRLKCEKALVGHFLSRAWSVLQDLKGRPAGLVGDLTAMEAILSDELSQLEK